MGSGFGSDGAAIRALVDLCLEDEDARRQARRATRSSSVPTSARRGRIEAQLDVAVDAQAEAWDQSLDSARTQLRALVDQLTTLADDVTWFDTDPRLREAAVAETVAYATSGAAVPSVGAQRAWVRHWQVDQHGRERFLRGLPHSLADHVVEVRQYSKDMGRTRAEWSEAWRRWATRADA